MSLKTVLEHALYIVATPIGNLEDISQRALTILAGVDKIAAEDTRHSKKLLTHYQIATKMVALHEHNEAQTAEKVLEFIKAGHSVALISDAGTPLISDPGYKLVSLAHQQQVKVITIPGACALIAGLAASGLPTDKFLFAGFLPAKTGARAGVLKELLLNTATVVLYEAPHRILATLNAIVQVCNQLVQDSANTRKIVLARELTKKHETILSGTIAEIIALVTADPMQQKGEFVILIEGHVCDTRSALLLPESADGDDASVIALEGVLKTLHAELPLAQAVQLAVKITGLKKNNIYKYMLGLSKLVKS